MVSNLEYCECQYFKAPPSYTPVDDLWIITSFYNPIGYETKVRNYRLFRQRIISGGLKLLTIECAFAPNRFTLQRFPEVVQIESRSVIWQKERLLNLALALLPKECTKVAWIDCDILFTNPGWALQTSKLLEHFPVLQPFCCVSRLPRGSEWVLSDNERRASLGAVYQRDPLAVWSGDINRHGEPGFAWAARREVLDSTGLYDACVTGGGDHLIAHAMHGYLNAPCILKTITARHFEHFYKWASKFHQSVLGRIGFVEGSILHLWHGQLSNRKYSQRHIDFKTFGFDPAKDIRVGTSGCWEWASDKTEMHDWVARYFADRKEDG